MRPAASSHLSGRLAGVAAESRPEAALGEEELQRLGGVRSKWGGVGGGQVQRREAAVGAAIELGVVTQENARHGGAAPPAGAVERRPAVCRSRVDRSAGGEQGGGGTDVAAVRGAVQRRVAVLVAAVGQLRLGRQQAV